MSRRILVLDFDGVIHMYKSPWKGPEVISDEPVFGAIQFMSEAIQHFDLAVLSSRSNTEGGRTAMQEYIRVHSGPLWYDNADAPRRGLNQVKFPAEKPPAHVLLDDRALNFAGIWPTIDYIKAFVPWNKR